MLSGHVPPECNSPLPTWDVFFLPLPQRNSLTPTSHHQPLLATLPPDISATRSPLCPQPDLALWSRGPQAPAGWLERLPGPSIRPSTTLPPLQPHHTQPVNVSTAIKGSTGRDSQGLSASKRPWQPLQCDSYWAEESDDSSPPIFLFLRLTAPSHLVTCWDLPRPKPPVKDKKCLAID